MVHDHKAIDHDLVPANPDDRCAACEGPGNVKALLADGESLHEYCAPHFGDGVCVVTPPPPDVAPGREQGELPSQLPRELSTPAPSGKDEERCYRQFNGLYRTFYAQEGTRAQRATARAIEDAHRYWEFVLGIDRAMEIKQRARYLAEPGVLVVAG